MTNTTAMNWALPIHWISKLKCCNVIGQHLKGGYHESVTNLTYAVVSLTTVRREGSFALSERFVTLPLVTSRISREGRGVTMKFTDDVRDSAPLMLHQNRHLSSNTETIKSQNLNAVVWLVSIQIFNIHAIYWPKPVDFKFKYCSLIGQ